MNNALPARLGPAFSDRSERFRQSVNTCSRVHPHCRWPAPVLLRARLLPSGARRAANSSTQDHSRKHREAMADDGNIITDLLKPNPAPNGDDTAPAAGIISQYIKDLSVENPNAPTASSGPTRRRSTCSSTSASRKINGDEVHEIELKIVDHRQVRPRAQPIIVDLAYCGLVGMRNLDEPADACLHLFAEAPRILFPVRPPHHCRCGARCRLSAADARSDRFQRPLHAQQLQRPAAGEGPSGSTARQRLTCKADHGGARMSPDHATSARSAGSRRSAGCSALSATCCSPACSARGWRRMPSSSPSSCPTPSAGCLPKAPSRSPSCRCIRALHGEDGEAKRKSFASDVLSVFMWVLLGFSALAMIAMPGHRLAARQRIPVSVPGKFELSVTLSRIDLSLPRSSSRSWRC